MTSPQGRLQVLRHHRFLQVQGGLPVSLLGLAYGERGPGAPLHELPFGGHGHALAGRALDVVVALGGLEREVAKMALHRVRVAVADVVHVVAAHHAGRPVRAVAVQVVVGAPPAGHTRAVLGGVAWLALFALAPLAVFVVPVAVVMMAMVVVVTTVGRARVTPFGAVHLGRALQRMGFGEEFLHRVHQVADAPGALVALLAGGRCGRALVLERVEAVAVDWQLLLELVQQIGRDAVHFAAAAPAAATSAAYSNPSAAAASAAGDVCRGAVVPRALVVRAVVHSWESAAGDVV